MGLSNLYSAIKARWTAAGLAATITGGIHDGQAPDSSSGAMPYVIVTTLPSAVRRRTSRSTSGATHTGGEYTARQFQLILHHTTGVKAMDAMNALVRAAFDNAPLALGGVETLYYCRWVADEILPMGEEPNWRAWVNVYEVLSGEAKTINPS